MNASEMDPRGFIESGAISATLGLIRLTRVACDELLSDLEDIAHIEQWAIRSYVERGTRFGNDDLERLILAISKEGRKFEYLMFESDRTRAHLMKIGICPEDVEAVLARICREQSEVLAQLVVRSAMVKGRGQADLPLATDDTLPEYCTKQPKSGRLETRSGVMYFRMDFDSKK